MATDKHIRLKVEAELSIGKAPKDLSRKYDVPYVTVLSWKKKLEETNDDVQTLITVDAPTLHKVAESVKENAPQDVIDKVDKIVDGVTSLKTLEPKFHAVVLKLLEKAEEFSKDDDLSIKDWKIIGDGISNMYANIFNKAGVNVNVLNQNQISGEKLSLFKSSLRS